MAWVWPLHYRHVWRRIVCLGSNIVHPTESARSTRGLGQIMTLLETKQFSHWLPSTYRHLGHFYITKMSSGTFVDRIDPFAKRSMKKKTKKSQGSSRYRNTQDVELQALPLLKGAYHLFCPDLQWITRAICSFIIIFMLLTQPFDTFYFI